MTTVLESPEHSAISQAPTDMITCYLDQEAVGKCSLVASLENQWQAPILSAYHQWLGFLPRCLPRAHRSPPPHHKTKQAAANRSSLVFNIETASQVTLGVKNPLAIRDSGSIPGLGRFPGAGCGNPLQYSCLENPHRQRSLACYRPWGHKELNTTEATNTSQQQNTNKEVQRIPLFNIQAVLKAFLTPHNPVPCTKWTINSKQPAGEKKKKKDGTRWHWINHQDWFLTFYWLWLDEGFPAHFDNFMSVLCFYLEKDPLEHCPSFLGLFHSIFIDISYHFCYCTVLLEFSSK